MKTAARYGLMLVLALLAVGPFCYLFVGSIIEGNVMSFFRGDPWHLHYTSKYYADVWGTFNAMGVWHSTVVICAVGVVVELLVASLAAYPLARMEFGGKNFIFMCMLSTMMLPAQASMIVNFTTIRHLGLFDTYTAVILPSAVSVFSIFLMRQAYLTIPRELEEAARIDGAGELTIWWRIMVPLSRPALGTLTIFSFVGYWNSFIWPLVVLEHENKYPLAVGLQYLSAVFDNSFSKVAAGSVIALVPIVLIFLLMQKQFISGITAGAVK